MDPKKILKDIFYAGLNAVKPDAAIARHLSLENGHLLVDGQSFWKMGAGSLYVVGAGKGAAPMAKALEKLLGPGIKEGFAVVKTGHELDLDQIEIGSASHPEPDENGLAASARIMEIAKKCAPGDLLICLFTGGASALTPAPVSGLSLAELLSLTRELLSCGATIQEINAIRKHLSLFSGGRLAKAAGGAKVLSLIVSDVVGDDLSAIASGPTAPDTSSFADCLAILEKHHLEKKMPKAAMRHLLAGAARDAEETPKPGDAAFSRVLNVIVASNAQALAACGERALMLGWQCRLVGDNVEGEAKAIALRLADMAKNADASKPLCLLAGGETTVKLQGRGKGGRNQEMALAAAIDLCGKREICALFAGTDGTDGPTDAAGGFALADTVEKMGGMETALGYLANNDSYHALKKAGDLFITGPTLTNVMDLAIILKNRKFGC